MPLENKTKGKMIIRKAKLAKTSAQRMRGLMFSRRPDYALILCMPRESRLGAAIHMLFVFYPIDVLFLNSKKQVVDKALGLRPFALNYAPKRAAKYVVELPEGLGKKARIGDLLDFP
ncbi:MAG: DUF192 domain-containing protein [Candidatus Diapherotrites archaeon]|nr:DUF192 domain-containing protein [Candidatus Diapherotrites archaeon]